MPISIKRPFYTLTLSSLLLLLILTRTPLLQHDLFTNIGKIIYLNEQHDVAPTADVAYQWLLAANKIIPTRLSSRLGLAYFYLQQNQPEKAIHILDQYDVFTPISDLTLGHALLKNEQTDTAIDKWNRAGVTSTYFIHLGVQNNDPFWFDLAIELDPSSHTYYQLARAYKVQSDDDKSINAYQAALTINSDWDSTHEQFLAQYHSSLLLYAHRKQYREAAQRHLLLALNMADSDYPATLPALYLRLGTMAMESEEHATAIYYFQELTTISQTENNYILLGSAVYTLEETIEPAIPFFIRAVEASDYQLDSIERITAIIANQAGNNFSIHINLFCSQLDESLTSICSFPQENN